MAKKKAARKVGKLGIYVPEHRQQQVEEWRDRLNFSEIFWRAFDEAVEFRKQVEVDDQELQALAMRLLKQRNIGWNVGYEQGIQEGKDWFKEHATVHEFLLVRDFDLKTTKEQEDVATALYDEEGVPCIVDERIRAKYGDLDFDEEYHFGYSLGFAVGGFEVWKQVSGLLDGADLESMAKTTPFASAGDFVICKKPEQDRQPEEGKQ